MGVVAVICIALGAALSPLPMLGLLGIPLVLAGGGMLISAITRAREDDVATGPWNAVGLLLEIPAGFGVTVSALVSCGLVWKYWVGIQRPGAEIYRVEVGDVVMAALAWLILPSLATLGIRLRTQWDGPRLLGWWLLTFSVQPAAVVCFMIVASGAPLTT